MRLITDRRVLLGLLVGYCLFLAWVVLWPSSAPATETVHHVSDALQRLDAPKQVTDTGRVEFALNTLMVVPVPLLASLLSRRWSWQQWTAYGFVASCAVEAFQGLFLADRAAQMPDIVSNTLGALVGGLLGAVLRRFKPTAG